MTLFQPIYRIIAIVEYVVDVGFTHKSNSQGGRQ